MFFKYKYLKLYIVCFLAVSLLFGGQWDFISKNDTTGKKTLILQNDGAVNIEKNLIVNNVENAYMPRGLIVMWSGSASVIPAGWALCDGIHATPNLTDRFIVGAGNSYAVGNTGGANTVVLTIAQMPAHSHDMSAAGEHTHRYRDKYPIANNDNDYALDNGGKRDDMSGNKKTTGEAGAHTHLIYNAGNGQGHENRPPYYALAFIRKL